MEFSRFMAIIVNLVNTKIMLMDQFDLLQSLKMFDSSKPDIRRLIQKMCGENPCEPSSTHFFGVIKCSD